jgi:hypothetical protein
MNIAKLAGYVGAVYGVLELNVDIIKDLVPRHARGSVLLGVCIVIVLYEHWQDYRKRRRG